MSACELMYLIKSPSYISGHFMCCHKRWCLPRFSLIISRRPPPCHYLPKSWESYLVKIFSDSVGCLCTLLIVSLLYRDFLISCPPLGSSACDTNILFPKFLPTSVSWKGVYMCFIQILSVIQVVKLRSLIHFE